jgi:5,10-methylenetetrahydromethanopterin reductase
MPGFEHMSLLAFGTVIDDDEDPTGERVRLSAGPGAAVVFHAVFESHPGVLSSLAGGPVYEAAIMAVPAHLRHLEIHRGHLTVLNQYDGPAMTAEMAAQFTLTGTGDVIRQRLAAMEDAGATEIAFQPAGTDLRRELRAFIGAAHG